MKFKDRLTISLYECPACGTLTENEIEPDECSSENYCRDCGAETKRADPMWREAEWFSIGLYMTDRRYGGPEEGGWYYTAGSLERGTAREFRMAELEEAIEFYNKLDAEAEEWNRDCCGDKMIVRIQNERRAATYFPEKRPYYC